MNQKQMKRLYIERFYLNRADDEYPMTVRIILQMKDGVDGHLLEEAVAATRTRYPYLCVKLGVVRDADGGHQWNSRSNLNMATNKRFHRHYDVPGLPLYWIIIAYIIIGYFWSVIGLLALICMIGPVLTSIWRGRWWCGNVCPRGNS